jgi:hypothetical protein
MTKEAGPIEYIAETNSAIFFCNYAEVHINLQCFYCTPVKK